MKTLKYTAGALAAALMLTVAFVAFAQSRKSGSENVKPLLIQQARRPIQQARRASKPKIKAMPQAHRSLPVMSVASAFAQSPEGRAREKALYAPSDAFYQQAKTLYASGDFAGAEAACLNALNAAPVIQGQKQHVPFVADLLGQVYLKDGQYEKAIHWLQGARQTTMDSSLNLNLALAYLRLGDYQTARRHYSDQTILRYASKDILPQDLPGTDSPAALEASILLARGLDASLEERNDEALADLQRANQLAPDNALVAYYCADLLNRKGLISEANSMYEIAAAHGRDDIAKDAKGRTFGMREWLAAHPGTP